MCYRTIRRSEWKQLKSTLYAETEFAFEGLSGIAGLVTMVKAEPFSVGPLVITGDGYRWLQLAFREKPVWATVMFDPAGELFQIYFDITQGNELAAVGNSRFADLYLDAVYTPRDQSFRKLDEEELRDAVALGKVTKTQAAEAENALSWLEEFMHTHAAAFTRYCAELKEQLEKRRNL